MKIGLVVASFCAMPVTATAAVVQSQDGTRAIYDVTVDGVHESKVSLDGMAYVKLSLEGVDGYEGVVVREGFPEVPAVRIVVVGGGDIAVTVESPATKNHLTGAHALVVPMLAPVARIPGAQRVKSFALGAYTDTPYPTEQFEVRDIGSVAGERHRLVSIHPIQYAGSSGTYTLTRHFRVAINDGVRPTVNPSVGGVTELMALLVGAKFKDSPSLARYIAFQKSLGFDTEVIAVPDGGSATPESIRADLRALYKRRGESLRYILIVGDQDDVPGHESVRVMGVNDHFYRAIDTDDYESDVGAPEASLGRWAVGSEADLQVVVDKTIAYVQGHFADDSWLDRASLIASDDSSWFKVAEDTMDYLADNFTVPHGYKGSFPAVNQVGGDRLYAIAQHATGADVLRQINEGRGFVTYGGHGSQSAWIGPEVTDDDVRTVNHPVATPYITSHACNNGDFIGDSFAEAWLRHPQGAVAIWASMDIDFWVEGDVLQRRVYDAIFKSKAKTIGAINDRAVSDIWTWYGGESVSRYYWEDYITFGDPSLPFRSQHPVDATVTRVGGSMQAPVLRVVASDGSLIEGARVGIRSMDGSFSRVVYSDDKGEVRPDLTLSGQALDAIQVSVTGRDVNLLQSQIALN